MALAIAPENRTLREMAANCFAAQGLRERALSVLSKRDIEISPLSAMVMASLDYPEHVHNYIKAWRDRPGGAFISPTCMRGSASTTVASKRFRKR